MTRENASSVISTSRRSVDGEVDNPAGAEPAQHVGRCAHAVQAKVESRRVRADVVGAASRDGDDEESIHQLPGARWCDRRDSHVIRNSVLPDSAVSGLMRHRPSSGQPVPPTGRRWSSNDANVALGSWSPSRVAVSWSLPKTPEPSWSGRPDPTAPGRDSPSKRSRLAGHRPASDAAHSGCPPASTSVVISDRVGRRTVPVRLDSRLLRTVLWASRPDCRHCHRSNTATDTVVRPSESRQVSWPHLSSRMLAPALP